MADDEIKVGDKVRVKENYLMAGKPFRHSKRPGGDCFPNVGEIGIVECTWKDFPTLWVRFENHSGGWNILRSECDLLPLEQKGLF